MSASIDIIAAEISDLDKLVFEIIFLIANIIHGYIYISSLYEKKIGNNDLKENNELISKLKIGSPNLESGIDNRITDNENNSEIMTDVGIK